MRILSPFLLVWPFVSTASTYDYEVKQGDTFIGAAERIMIAPGSWPRVQALNGIADRRPLLPDSFAVHNGSSVYVDR